MIKATLNDAITSKAWLTRHSTFTYVSTDRLTFNIIGVIQRDDCQCWHWTAFHSDTEKSSRLRYSSVDEAHIALIRDAIKAGAIT